MANTIAKGIKILVRSVLAKFEPLLAQINVDLFAPDTEKWANNDKIKLVDAARGDLTHSGETSRSCTAEQVQEKSLDEIVCMMCQKNRAAATSLRNFGKKRVARLTRRGFDRHPLFLCERANVCRTDLKIDTVFRGEFFDKAGISLGGAPAEVMIKMADDQFAIAKIDQPA